VGVVASLGTDHGNHSHISVYIRGSVTMACDLSEITGHLPLSRLYLGNEGCAARFAGIGDRITPPTITTQKSTQQMIGFLVERGRMPTNEIRIMLSHTII